MRNNNFYDFANAIKPVFNFRPIELGLGPTKRLSRAHPGGIQWGQKVRHEDINVGGKYYWAQNEYKINAILSY